ncbi:MAG: hypothetical protein KBT33_05025 [Prevotellaceae bacterium]|nr:hypothetical protein [Candidatus Minthosoma equi]
MDQISTTTETIIAYGNDTWENLGDVTLYYKSSNGCKEASGTSATLLFKMVPGLGKRFKIVYKEKVYSIEKNKTCRLSDCNAYIGAIDRYLNVEGYE